MTEDVGHEIDVARLAVKVGAERGAQFVRTQVFFQRRGLRGVLFDHLLHGAHGDAPVLQGEKERVFMSRQGRHRLAGAEIVLEDGRDFVGKVENRLTAAFARDHKAADIKIQIVDVNAYQFADADARAEKEREDGKISQPRVVVIALLMLRLFFTALHEIEQARHFIHLEADDRLAMSFGHINQKCYIRVN